MMIKFLSILIASSGVMWLQQKQTTIWMIGDSTMSVKAATAFPETGWGMPFAAFWDSTIRVDNRAVNGRSTRTFLEENRWQPVLDGLREGDYVFIQFGHNDEVPTKKSYVEPELFRKNLERYIGDVRSRKAIPVLLTSVARRKFDSTGHIIDTHADYGAITRSVASLNKVVLIDAGRLTEKLLTDMGPRNSAYLFNHLKPLEHPNYPDGVNDDTHLNELGARRVAELVLGEIRKQLPELANHIRNKLP